MFRWMLSSALVLVVSVVAACGGSPRPAPPGTATTTAPGVAADSPAADRTAEAPTVEPLPEDTPVALPRTAPAATRTATLVPESPRAEPGVAYDFELMVHCGVDYGVDFDGSFWDLSARKGIPSYRGKMTLISSDRARFDFDPYSSVLPPGGGGADLASYHFTRREGPKTDLGPCV